MKSRSLALGILLGITAVISMAVVFIDSTQNYWYVNGGFVKLIVSNQTSQAIMTVDTNTMRVGFNTNNTARSFVVVGQKGATNAAGNGGNAAISGAVQLVAGGGGDSTLATTASGGNAGPLQLFGGTGGSAQSATTNATGGVGGSASLQGGTGGAGSSANATNEATGGAGGGVTLSAGGGGQPSAPATNTVGGAGGTATITSAGGSAPSAGWARKGGNGGAFTLTAGNGGNSVRTNGGNGAAMTLTAGGGGAVTANDGNAGNAGAMSITAGAGAAGAGTGTNSDGAHVFIAGGAPGSGAVPGNVVLARTSAGTSLGAGVQIGPLITGGSATITNVLGAAALLDFPSTAAGTVSDLPIAVTGVTSNNAAIAMSVPWQSTFGNGGIFSYFNSNDAVYVRFANNNLVTAIDPDPGTFTVVAFRIR